MKFIWNKKDGGLESRVWMYGLEIKSLFSILILRFEDGSREAYHSHAFNCLNWVLKGKLLERRMSDKYIDDIRLYQPYLYLTSYRPFIIRREHLHKVTSKGRTFVLSFRGPWINTWKEWLPLENREITLTHGRKEI